VTGRDLGCTYTTLGHKPKPLGFLLVRDVRVVVLSLRNVSAYQDEETEGDDEDKSEDSDDNSGSYGRRHGFMLTLLCISSGKPIVAKSFVYRVVVKSESERKQVVEITRGLST